MRIEHAERRARCGAEPIDALPQQHRRQSRKQKEWHKHKRGRPGKHGERNQDRRRHDDGDDRRSDGMGVEIFDCFDVLRRQRHQIAGAAAQQIAGRQRIELAKQRDAHVGEQVIGHGVRLPRLGPVQNAGERRDDGKPDQTRVGWPVFSAATISALTTATPI